MDQNRLAFLALHFISGVGDQLIKQLVSYCGSAEQVFKTPKGKLLKIPGIGRITAESIHKGSTFHRAEKELKKHVTKWMQHERVLSLSMLLATNCSSLSYPSAAGV